MTREKPARPAECHETETLGQTLSDENVSQEKAGFASRLSTGNVVFSLRIKDLGP
jgi:hypothetical protein